MAKIFAAGVVFAFMIGIGSVGGHAQNVPALPDCVWHFKVEQDLGYELASRFGAKYDMDANKSYMLAEFIDLAQQHNLATRVAWEEVKAKVAALGIARSVLYLTIVAVVLAFFFCQAVFIGEFFHRQTIGLFEPTVHVEYLVFDFGGRVGVIDVVKANLLVSNLVFNDTHCKVIF